MSIMSIKMSVAHYIIKSIIRKKIMFKIFYFKKLLELIFVFD